MSGMTTERLAEIRANLPDPSADLSRRERDSHALLAHVDHLTAESARTRYVVFDADWVEPPGDVIAVFATKAEAWAHIRGPGDGYGWSIVEVPAPAVEP